MSMFSQHEYKKEMRTRSDAALERLLRSTFESAVTTEELLKLKLILDEWELRFGEVPEKQPLAA